MLIHPHIERIASGDEGCTCPKCSLFAGMPPSELHLAKIELTKLMEDELTAKHTILNEGDVVIRLIEVCKERMGKLADKYLGENSFRDARPFQTWIDEANVEISVIREANVFPALPFDEAMQMILEHSKRWPERFWLMSGLYMAREHGGMVLALKATGLRLHARVDVLNAYRLCGVDAERVVFAPRD